MSTPRTDAPAGRNWWPIAASLAAVVLLVLWLAPLRSDPLTVTFVRGEVYIEDADGTRTMVEPGDPLTEGERIVVPSGGAASLSSPDGHTLTLTDSARMGVRSNSRPVLGRPAVEMELEEGRVQVTGESTDGGTMDLSTPHGVAGVRGTVFIATASTGASTFSMHQGRLVLASQDGEEADLAPGQGAIATPQGASVRALPPSPAIQAPDPGQLVTDSTTAIVWSAVADAAAYGVEFARDVGFTEIMSRVVVTGTQTPVPALDEDMPVYYRVYAITGDGLESAPSAERLAHVRLRFVRGQALQAAGDVDGSIAELTAALPNYRTDPRLLKDLAWSLYLAERLEESRDYYREALVQDESDHEAHLEVGRVLFWLEEYDEAEMMYQAVLDDVPRDADALWGLGDVYRMTGRREEAEELLLRALAVDPAHPYAAESLDRLRSGG